MIFCEILPRIKKKEYKLLTIKRFLKSLIDFCMFIIDDGIVIPNVPSEDILRMKVRVNQWKKSNNNSEKAQELTRMAEEQEVLITPEQIQAYEVSEGARAAVVILEIVASPYAKPIVISSRFHMCP